MPQATGRAQSRARAGRSGGATGAVRRAGACISARIPLVGASSERRVIAALFLLPEYRRFTANRVARRSEEHTSELQSLMRISYAVFCLKKKKENNRKTEHKK